MSECTFKRELEFLVAVYSSSPVFHKDPTPGIEFTTLDVRRGLSSSNSSVLFLYILKVVVCCSCPAFCCWVNKLENRIGDFKISLHVGNVVCRVCKH